MAMLKGISEGYTSIPLTLATGQMFSAVLTQFNLFSKTSTGFR